MNEHVYMMIFGSSDGSDTRDMIVVERLPDGRYRASDILAKMGACVPALVWLRGRFVNVSFSDAWLSAGPTWRHWLLYRLGWPSIASRKDLPVREVEQRLFDYAKRQGWIK